MSALRKLTKRHEFVKVAQQGKYASAASVIVQLLIPSEAELNSGPRFGFTASKRVGNAIRRNRAKRRLREAIRELKVQQIEFRGDLVVIAKPNAVDVPFDIILRDIKYCLRKCFEAYNGH